MRARASLLAAALCLLGAALPALAPAAGTEGPAWTVVLTPLPANLPPGGDAELLALATNVGGAATSGASRVEVSLPEGLQLEAAKSEGANSTPPFSPLSCTPSAEAFACETTEALGPGRFLLLRATVKVTALSGTITPQARASGGGGGEATAQTPIPVQPGPVPFGYLPGFAAPATQPDGAPAVLAGSHPYQQTIEFGFPTRSPGEGILTNDEHPRDFYTELPRGLLGDPAATPVLCTEAELEGPGCPKDSQLGVTDVTSLLGEAGVDTVFTTPLYDMVPPPGSPAGIATDVANVGVYVHVLASLRSGTDYGVKAAVRDAIAFGQQPIFDVQAQLWGDPSGLAHEDLRDKCIFNGGLCKAEVKGELPFLTMPGDCPGTPREFEVHADTWENPSPPGEEARARYRSADLHGNEVHMEGCGELEFEPAIRARPQTTRADSPTGLDFELEQPQEPPRAEPLEGRATAILKDATVTFPAGLAVNPSQAAGLGACSEDQVGYTGKEGDALRFTEDPQSCPDEAKIGTVEATSPLLVQRDENHEVEIDPETGAPEPEPLHGSLYLATPFANPFGSLVAVYLTVEDEKTGIVAKLAGEGQLDPTTGQISTRFAENPEVPIEDVRVHVFGGDRGAFITPQSCGEYETRAELTPWSAPEGAVAHKGDSFPIDEAPGGGSCPAAQPNEPKLQAGTLEPVAGKYSPLVFKLTREDGSERLAKVEATLPPGLTAKLAGLAQCSEAEIAKARSREAPNQGALELADPSCPAASKVGTVDVGAGAGPHPYHVQGSAYLAGPYKGAPLSFVIITPAVAGPFDLGAVVVRVAVFLDPETARPRAVSDPLPQLLDGVPADVRSVRMELSRPSFTLNPTSCNEESFSGQAISALGHVASLTERFQVGGCQALPYGPKLTARLFGPAHRGAHPRLRAVFQAKPGEANTARLSFALPHSEFIDQGHFRTICTRVQFAAHACPAGSVYGHMKAITPLLDHPLEGPIYLRSSSHELPDVVAALHGPPSQPIEVALDGEVDSVHGGVRTTFAAVPDAPVTKAIVTMQGKKKGLFQNSTDICRAAHRATLKLIAQNGKRADSRPLLKASCPKGPKRHRRHRHRASRK